MVEKSFSNQGKLESNLGRDPRNRLKIASGVAHGKKAITHFRVIKYYKQFSHIELKLETGRTHQIRVHLNSLLKMPLLCDPLYSNPMEHRQRLGHHYKDVLADYPYPFLHATVLGFIHPRTKKYLEFHQGPPKIFQHILSLGEKHYV